MVHRKAQKYEFGRPKSDYHNISAACPIIWGQVRPLFSICRRRQGILDIAII
jgi:hypothetical protein